MSYDIRVVRKNADGKSEDVFLKDAHTINGGTYCAGGTTEAWFNITYNYAKFFYDIWPETDENDEKGGIRHLYGRPLPQVVQMLTDAINSMNGEPDDDYWKGTEGNAKKSLEGLRSICEFALADYPNDNLILVGD